MKRDKKILELIMSYEYDQYAPGIQAEEIYDAIMKRNCQMGPKKKAGNSGTYSYNQAIDDYKRKRMGDK